jgi:adenine-specific DNA-methyltransferase
MINPDKMKFQTPNLTAENVAKLAELFPGAVAEGKVNIDLLRAMLGEDVFTDEAYEFTWVGKRAVIAEAGRPIRRTLRPAPDESKDWDATENLYIEGDNLDVLKLLQESYLGKVKMIYIDPPYNTGNDFIYRDDFTQSREDYEEESGVYDEDGARLYRNTESNGRFHSDWCSMIYPRLVLARNLLRDDGVIFIQIDDNEFAQLYKMCDEVFGVANCIGVIVQNKQNAKNDTINIQKNHEYLLAYRRAVLFNDGNVIPSIYRFVQKQRDAFKENGRYYYLNDAITTRGEGGTLRARPNLGYTVYYNPETGDKLAVCDYDVSKATEANDYDEIYTPRSDLIEHGYVAIRPPKVRGNLGVWTWSLEKFNSEKDKIVITGGKGSFTVRKRTFVSDKSIQTIDGKLQFIETDIANVRSLWDYSTNQGTIALNDVMGASSIFDNPKNIDMIEQLVRIVQDREAIVLDFFSGSATTAHAVMQLNAEDGGKRKFIMVQLPEICAEGTEAAKAGYSTICEIGKERIRRAGEKIKAEAGLTVQGLDVGFRVLKLDDTNMNDVYYSAAEVVERGQLALFEDESNIKPNRTDMDLLFGCLLEWGLPLSMPHTHEKIDGFTVHTYNSGDLIACFEEKISETAIREIAGRKLLRAVFRDASFTSSPQKINVFEIFKLLAPNTKVKVI